VLVGLAALAAILVGLVVRLVLFVMTPTIYGLENTIVYIENNIVTTAFDGWPTFIAFGASLLTYVAVSLATPPAPLRGLDLQVAQDVDDVLGATAETIERKAPAPAGEAARYNAVGAA
jgi:SSS family solute:Na+ symporter